MEQGVAPQRAGHGVAGQEGAGTRQGLPSLDGHLPAVPQQPLDQALQGAVGGGRQVVRHGEGPALRFIEGRPEVARGVGAARVDQRADEDEAAVVGQRSPCDQGLCQADHDATDCGGLELPQHVAHARCQCQVGRAWRCGEAQPELLAQLGRQPDERLRLQPGRVAQRADDLQQHGVLSRRHRRTGPLQGRCQQLTQGLPARCGPQQARQHPGRSLDPRGLVLRGQPRLHQLRPMGRLPTVEREGLAQALEGAAQGGILDGLVSRRQQALQQRVQLPFAHVGAAVQAVQGEGEVAGNAVLEGRCGPFQRPLQPLREQRRSWLRRRVGQFLHQPEPDVRAVRPGAIGQQLLEQRGVERSGVIVELIPCAPGAGSDLAHELADDGLQRIAQVAAAAHEQAGDRRLGAVALRRLVAEGRDDGRDDLLALGHGGLAQPGHQLGHAGAQADVVEGFAIGRHQPLADGVREGGAFAAGGRPLPGGLEPVAHRLVQAGMGAVGAAVGALGARPGGGLGFDDGGVLVAGPIRRLALIP